MSGKILLGIGVIVLGVGGVFYSSPQSFSFLQGSTSTSSPSLALDESSAATSSSRSDPDAGQAPAASREAPAGFKPYTNTKYHFSLFYPEALAVEEHAEDGGMMTITFQNVDSVQGFQVFIVPYFETQISEERFKQDIPSGVRRDPKDIVIDGATAASFYSANVSLGDTAEIWFIKNGYLYEVTTLKPLDTWLSQIMMTWKFSR